MDKKLAEAILKEKAKRKTKINAADDILKSQFKQQLDFIKDPCRFKVARCTRRAGKTFCAASYLIYTCLTNPGVNCVYIALSRATAKRLIWPQISKFNDKYGLNIQKNMSELSFSFDNGSNLYLIGANDEATCENLRGDKYKLVVLDEAASYRRHIDNLIDAIITPALIDLRGTLCLIGTPGPILDGAFYKADHHIKPYAEYSAHFWSLLDNPHIKEPEKFLEEHRRNKGISINNPIYQREYEGKWVRADDHFVYRVTDNNIVDVPDKKDFFYILGVDLGFDDATAVCVLAYSAFDSSCYVVDSVKKNNLHVSAMVDLVKEYQKLYNPVSIVCDTGGLGKSIVEEMRIRYAMPIKAAEKKNKFEYIELINSDFFEKKLLIDRNQEELLSEIQLLQFDEDKREIPDKYEDHLCDAMLYAWRESKHFAPDEKEPKKPEFNTPEYWEAIEAKRLKDTEERMERLIQEGNEQKEWEKQIWGNPLKYYLN